MPRFVQDGAAFPSLFTPCPALFQMQCMLSHRTAGPAELIDLTVNRKKTRAEHEGQGENWRKKSSYKEGKQWSWVKPIHGDFDCFFFFVTFVGVCFLCPMAGNTTRNSTTNPRVTKKCCWKGDVQVSEKFLLKPKPVRQTYRRLQLLE